MLREKLLSADQTKTALKGPEKWLAIAENRKKVKKELKKIQTALSLRSSRLTDPAARSQYFVDKYPLIEKTREEWRIILEEKARLITTR